MAMRPMASLTDRVAESLNSDIASGKYRPGQALPPEKTMALGFGVSRTVMREAISRLKAEGLVSTRQGLGVFVAKNPPPEVFRIDPSSYGDPAEILKIVELRMGFEAEAAALAAARRTASDLKEMRAALKAMEMAIASGHLEQGVTADVAFHRAICVATHSRYYPEFFNSLSQFLAENISVSRRHSSQRASRGAEAQAEHAMIWKAISDRDSDAARSAVRTHLENTAERLRLSIEDDRAAAL